MEPNSNVLLVLLLLVGAGLIFAAVKIRFILVKVLSGLLAMVMSMAAGMAIVNDYYGYYQTWSQLTADLNGSYSNFNSAPTLTRSPTGLLAGSLRTIQLPGHKSGINRSGIIYLPPQYFEKQYAHTRFPVIELLHGSPGNPGNWVRAFNLKYRLDSLIGQGLMGPVIAVLPDFNSGHHYQECVDAPGALDDTYITQDVRTDIVNHYRASTVPAEWGIAGFSSGGYCAANLSLRHQADFGAVGIMDGYFRPTDGPAARALHGDPLLMAANNPLEAARHLPAGTRPLPAFWLSAGTGEASDVVAAEAFVGAMRGVEQVTLIREHGAGHNFNSWRAVVAPMLTWMWTQLAPPELRVQFPPTGNTKHSIYIAEPPHKQDGKRARTSSIARGSGIAEPTRAPR